MDNKLLLADLVQALVDKGFTRKDTEAFVRCFFQQVEKSVIAGDSVKIDGLGTFRLQKVEPRRSVNVHTGEQIEIEGHNKFSYLPDAGLKEAVNQPYAHLDNAEMEENDLPETPLFSVYDPSEVSPASDAPSPAPATVSVQTAEKEPGIKIEVMADKKTENRTENNADVCETPSLAGLVFKILGTCILLAGIIYLFMHSESLQTTYKDSPQITVASGHTAESAQIESTKPSEPAQAESTQPARPEPVQPESAKPELSDNPSSWEVLKTVTVGRGDMLTIYALQNYGDKVFWVYIFLANRDVLKNPNSLPKGTVIRIPKAPESVINASDPASIAKARALEEQLKARYD